MNWWQALVEVFKVGVQAKNVRDQKKAAETLLAEQRAAEAAALAATNDAQRQAFTAQANMAKLAYGSLTTPGTIGTPQASGSALDKFLPFVVVGVIALGAFSILRK